MGVRGVLHLLLLVPGKPFYIIYLGTIIGSERHPTKVTFSSGASYIRSVLTCGFRFGSLQTVKIVNGYCNIVKHVERESGKATKFIAPCFYQLLLVSTSSGKHGECIGGFLTLTIPAGAAWMNTQHV